MENNRYFVGLYKWVDLEGECEELKAIEIDSPEDFEKIKKHAEVMSSEGKLLPPHKVAYQYILEDIDDNYLDDCWTSRKDLI